VELILTFYGFVHTNASFFTNYTDCQCNGHSTCMNNTDVCIHPCSNNTEGQNCETCIKGFYGNPVNGGECKGNILFRWLLLLVK